ncbi:response regulator transcription factor [Pleionea sediminis]|uniref:response regulator transcription factor n=1 Tax=Pleionea sediminis TaxID=2569479 RepID=UPI001184A9DB|nr:response regulator transcription factor [Pleionea sediminis]
MHKILLVDDDEELCELLSEFLSQEGFTVEMVHDGGAVSTMLNNHQFDLIVLDVMLPTKSGFEVLKELSVKKKTPVLMLTAKGDEIDRILGLELGADDYLSKPCNPRELTARIRSIIRRVEALPPSLQLDQEESSRLYADIKVIPSKRQVFLGDSEVELTGTEYEILMLLLDNVGALVTRESISEQCLGRRLMAFDRSIDMHISHVRKKLGVSPDNKERIKTIRGVGYQYVAI